MVALFNNYSTKVAYCLSQTRDHRQHFENVTNETKKERVANLIQHYNSYGAILILHFTG